MGSGNPLHRYLTFSISTSNDCDVEKSTKLTGVGDGIEKLRLEVLDDNGCGGLIVMGEDGVIDTISAGISSFVDCFGGEFAVS